MSIITQTMELDSDIVFICQNIAYLAMTLGSGASVDLEWREEDKEEEKKIEKLSTRIHCFQDTSRLFSRVEYQVLNFLAIYGSTPTFSSLCL